MEAHRWDRPFATKAFTPPNATMFRVSFKGKIMMLKMAGERYKVG